MDENPDQETELNLAKLLKNKYCDDTGKETQPKRAAEIIHKLGKIYNRRSPDKISLIKSVALFNAAIVRNPSNLSDVKNDLSNICQHILNVANAKLQNADLMKKAHEVKQLFIELRDEVDQLLEQAENQKTPFSQFKHVKLFLEEQVEKQQAITKISSVQQLNEFIALKYKQIMANLGEFCENVMGKPPCKYAIAGMGSLARLEITPYSDFEHIILLFDDEKYESYLEYFRWYSVIFHTVILNLQETIIPSLNIESLGNWYFDAFTPRGISFDGMMPHASKFPLGRLQLTKDKPFETELIKPVSKMLEYLGSEADLKNGYHLADILTKTCFVFGDINVFKQFKSEVEIRLKQTPKQTRIEEVKEQVKDDLDNYSTRFRLAKLKSNHTINIKQLIYRSSTLFIAALGRIHNILAHSSFEIVNEMQNIGEITKSTQIKLNYAIAIACEIRLKIYSKNKCQNDSPIRLTHDDKDVNQILDFVGAASTIKYFQIAYCLQCEVAKQLNFTKLHFYSDPQIINFKLGLIFEMEYLKANIIKNRPKFIWDRNKFDFDKCIKRLETSVHNIHASTTSDSTTDKNLILSLADHLNSIKAHDDALEFYEATLEMYRNVSLDEPTDGNIASTLNNVGSCLKKMQRFGDALIHLKQSLEIYRNISLDEPTDGNIASTLNNVGNCLLEMQRYGDALNHLKQSLEIYRNVSLDGSTDGNIASTLNNVGLCLMEMQRYGDALIHLKQSLEIYRNISLDEPTDGNIARTINNVGLCLMEMQRYGDALIHLKQSLEIYRNISLDEPKDGNIARTLNNVGLCLMELQRYGDALIHLKQSLEIYRNISLDEPTDGNIALTLNNVGNCFKKMQRYGDALIHLKQSLEIYRNISFDEPTDGNIASTLNNVGLCLMELQRYGDALIHLKQSLEIDRNTSFDEPNDGNIALTLNNVGLCLMELQRYSDALIHLKHSLEIYKSISLDEPTDGNIALTLNNVGLCLMEMQRYGDALIHLKQSLEIYRNISLDEPTDGNIALTLNNVGNCFKKMQRYSDALIHLQKSLEIYGNISLDEPKDRNIASTLNNVGLCLMEMQRYGDALIHLKQSLEIYRNISLDEPTDGNIASTLNNVGLCLMEMQRYGDALIHLKQSLEIYRNISLDEPTDGNIALTLNNVGLCLMEMQCYGDALIHLKQSLEIYRNISLDEPTDGNIALTLNNVELCLMEM